MANRIKTTAMGARCTYREGRVGSPGPSSAQSGPPPLNAESRDPCGRWLILASVPGRLVVVPVRSVVGLAGCAAACRGRCMRMSGAWDADPQARLARRIGIAPSELGTTGGRDGCPDIWELDNGDFAVIGRDLT